jgi:hypothetical protein
VNAYIRRALKIIAAPTSHGIGIGAMKVAIAIIFLWIGALKFIPYEADSITPFVANSPVMSFFYEHPAEYKEHLTHEGELKRADRAWQTANNTYGFSTGLGTLELIIGGMTLAGLVSQGRPDRRGSRLRHAVCDAFIPIHDARSMGARTGRRSARISLPLRRGTPCPQGRGVDGRRLARAGRYGASPAAGK